MKNRNQKTELHPIPKRCPRCGGNVLPGCKQIGERFLHGWECLQCGETSDGYEVRG